MKQLIQYDSPLFPAPDKVTDIEELFDLLKTSLGKFFKHLAD